MWQVASWGGYSFIINLLPIHCLACVVTGRLTPKVYIAYAPFVVLGTLTAGAELCPCPHGIPLRLSDICACSCTDQVKYPGRNGRCMRLTPLVKRTHMLVFHYQYSTDHEVVDE